MKAGRPTIRVSFSVPLLTPSTAGHEPDPQHAARDGDTAADPFVRHPRSVSLRARPIPFDPVSRASRTGMAYQEEPMRHFTVDDPSSIGARIIMIPRRSAGKLEDRGQGFQAGVSEGARTFRAPRTRVLSTDAPSRRARVRRAMCGGQTRRPASRRATIAAAAPKARANRRYDGGSWSEAGTIEQPSSPER